MKIEFKKPVLIALCPMPDKIVNVWDSITRGLGLRITPNGTKTFVFKYRFGSKQVWYKIGRLGEWTIDQARKRVIELRLDVDKGINPAKTIRDRKAAMTVNEAALRMLDEHAPHVRASTLSDYKSYVDRYIIPTFGTKLVTDLAPLDASHLHQKLQKTPNTANMALAVLSLICNYAEKWSERPLGSNPCQHQKQFQTKSRQRYLSGEEIQAIGQAIKKLEASIGNSMADLFRIIMLTGARKGEIVYLKWEQVDLENKRLLLDPLSHKTGGMSRSKQIPLGDSAVALLADKLTHKTALVFPNKNQKPYTTGTIFRAWQRIQKQASKNGIDVMDVHIHDLRHTWGAMATSGGHALQTIGAVMGHRNTATTARYAHVAPSPAAKAVQETSQKIADALAISNKKVIKKSEKNT